MILRTRSVAVAPCEKLAGQIHADDIRGQEIYRLAEHSRFGLDPADAPADDTEAVDHRRMRIRADKRIREINAIPLENSFRQIFEIDLMDDADSRRDDAKAVERLSSPL